MPRGRSVKVLVNHREDGRLVRRPDQLVVEEPMEIRLDDHLVTTTMRTPGHDYELAVGYCSGEGLLDGAPVQRVRYCATGSADATAYNVVTVETGGRGRIPEPRLATATSSCGLCGATNIDDLRDRLTRLEPTVTFDVEVLAAVPDRVRAQQTLFEATGGVHAAAAFDIDGRPVVVREDIGRHNAVDKVVGRLRLDDQLPAAGLGLFVSGRASFEIMQKAWAAGFGTVVAVSAPSSMAVETARAAGITLVGFARGDRLNVYAPA